MLIGQLADVGPAHFSSLTSYQSEGVVLKSKEHYSFFFIGLFCAGQYCYGNSFQYMMEADFNC
jgi:hypothetical protein